MTQAYYRDTIRLLVQARNVLGLPQSVVDELVGGADGYTAKLERTAEACDSDPRPWMRQATWLQVHWWSEALAVRPALILDPVRLSTLARRHVQAPPGQPVTLILPDAP